MYADAAAQEAARGGAHAEAVAFLRIAVDHQADVIFMLEDFCGHGFERDNPAAPCYRGPGQAAWFDLTCIHPNPTGHDHVTDMFMAVVNE